MVILVATNHKLTKIESQWRVQHNTCVNIDRSIIDLYNLNDLSTTQKAQFVFKLRSLNHYIFIHVRIINKCTSMKVLCNAIH